MRESPSSGLNENGFISDEDRKVPIESPSSAFDYSSDEDTKVPIVSQSPEMSPSNTQIVGVKPTPNNPIPQNILSMLEDWHKENGPKRPPPCSCYDSHTVMFYKIFDRNGEELILTNYSITKPTQYNALVLSMGDKPARLVACASGPRKFGTFLVAWNGNEKGYETECCAVRIFGWDSSKIKCSKEVWDNAPANPTPTRSNAPTGAQREKSQETQPQTQSQSQTQLRPRRGRERSKRPRHSTPARMPASSESSSTSDSSSEDDDSSDDESSEREKPSASASKKRKRDEPETKRTVKTEGNAILFNFVNYRMNAIRKFPLEDCKTAKDLFAKAQGFFPLFSKGAKVSVLSCQIPTYSAQHYLFENSGGEFESLVNDAKSIDRTDDGKLVIEVVNHVV
ncbi:hypothetical protein ASPWEDRAFT_173541 [Aspergillus wentii DTO 134E9]|uniref:Uncharacterized protein n=1 Tax=Aspergillus wentii DTO 134E9 TaxID=1073089 RepID=A0A1L9RGQ9_ASPWE|nr:uncharacterized protein ASPWEDRAFT_173541 [Aspergillus wentii DTO 134E9]OJJ34112.1 hypothetical protein ASPWEDRAFT_173541 [Aspergillus wentii DTO 134E9]